MNGILNQVFDWIFGDQMDRLVSVIGGDCDE